MKHEVMLEALGKSDDGNRWIARCLQDHGVRGQVKGGPNDKEPPAAELARMLADMGELCGGVPHEVVK